MKRVLASNCWNTHSRWFLMSVKIQNDQINTKRGYFKPLVFLRFKKTTCVLRALLEEWGSNVFVRLFKIKLCSSQPATSRSCQKNYFKPLCESKILQGVTIVVFTFFFFFTGYKFYKSDCFVRGQIVVANIMIFFLYTNMGFY